MEKKKLYGILAVLPLLAGSLLVTSCSTADDVGEPLIAYELADAGPGNGTGGNTLAGIVTAAEWNDLQYWPFWSKLMVDGEYGKMSDYWKFYTCNRVAVSVSDAASQPLAGAVVRLMRGDDTLWQAVTDNHGKADCWLGLFQKEDDAAQNNLSISIDGQIMEGHPVVCHWDSLALKDSLTAPLAATLVNHYVVSKSQELAQQADIAFIVDATGSMSDEINFLKSDLTDIIGKVTSVRPDLQMRTAALFYRDEGDDYLTRHNDFSEQVTTTAEFVDNQQAQGGGDYPEAVHTALEQALQVLSWNEHARTRLAFLILDAPAHHEDAIIRSLQQSVMLFAAQGIRLIPVAASGVDKHTEFMLRFFATATGGTYVFLTNDSGVGNDHIEASVGPHQVEQLNSLLIRLIRHYTE